MRKKKIYKVISALLIFVLVFISIGKSEAVTVQDGDEPEGVRVVVCGTELQRTGKNKVFLTSSRVSAQALIFPGEEDLILGSLKFVFTPHSGKPVSTKYSASQVKSAWINRATRIVPEDAIWFEFWVTDVMSDANPPVNGTLSIVSIVESRPHVIIYTIGQFRLKFDDSRWQKGEDARQARRPPPRVKLKKHK